jgi:hypothetical protein
MLVETLDGQHAWPGERSMTWSKFPNAVVSFGLAESAPAPSGAYLMVTPALVV